MAKLTTCKTCGRQLATDAKRCPHCGAATYVQKVEDVAGYIGAVLGLALVAAIVAICAGAFNGGG